MQGCSVRNWFCESGGSVRMFVADTEVGRRRESILIEIIAILYVERLDLNHKDTESTEE